jgi:hypothetical protein
MLNKKFDLQLFAEGGTEPPAGTDPNAGKAGEPGKQDPPAEPEKKYTDADVDKIVKDRIARERADHEKAIEEAKAEAAKLAKMNEDQKRQYEAEKQQEENKKLQEENAKLTMELARVELNKTAADILTKNDIDATPDVIDLVVGADAEETKANIDAFVKAVEVQVKKAETARATGTTPRNIVNNSGTISEIEKRIAKYK